MPPGGAWLTRAYDLADDKHQMAEHGRALTEWGAPFVAETLAAWLEAWGSYAACEAQGEALPADDQMPDTMPDGSVSRGERAVRVALRALADGVAEVPPGSNTLPSPSRKAGRLVPPPRVVPMLPTTPGLSWVQTETGTASQARSQTGRSTTTTPTSTRFRGSDSERLFCGA